MRNRKVKSNRAQADYFELLVAEYISDLYKLKFPHTKVLESLSKEILRLPDGKARLDLQLVNLSKIKRDLVKVLDYETANKGPVIEVDWIGRKLSIKTTSDIDAKHKSHRFTRFSIKSISEAGTGTIKNLGMRSLVKFLNINFDEKYKNMWKELRSRMREQKISQLKLKKKVLRNQKLLDWGNSKWPKISKEIE